MEPVKPTTQVVVNMDTQEEYWFMDCTPYQALCRMLYCLNIKRRDNDARIHKTESGQHFWLEHRGVTYAVKNY